MCRECVNAGGRYSGTGEGRVFRVVGAVRGGKRLRQVIENGCEAIIFVKPRDSAGRELVGRERDVSVLERNEVKD